MANPRDRATGGVNSKLFVNGVHVGMVQNANFNRVIQKIAINETGTPRTREHVPNGVVCTLSIGFIYLFRNTLEAQGLLYPTNSDDADALLNFEAIQTLDFRTIADDLIIRAEDVTPSNDSLQFTRDTVYGHNVNFDACWFRTPAAD